MGPSEIVHRERRQLLYLNSSVLQVCEILFLLKTYALIDLTFANPVISLLACGKDSSYLFLVELDWDRKLLSSKIPLIFR